MSTTRKKPTAKATEAATVDAATEAPADQAPVEVTSEAEATVEVQAPEPPSAEETAQAAAEAAAQAAQLAAAAALAAADDAGTAADAQADAAAATEAAAAAELAARIAEADAAAAAAGLVAPSVAPLEPPTGRVEVQVEAEYVDAASTGVAMIQATSGPVIFDDATGELPDPDEVFTSLFEHGTVVRCNKRLIERIDQGRADSVIERLLLPAGAQVTARQASAVVAKLREQQAAKALADAAEVTEDDEDTPES